MVAASSLAQNDQRRARLRRLLAPVTANVDRQAITRAPYALHTTLSDVQRHSLISHAIELGGPPGTVIGRQIPPDSEGCTVEVLIGWERVEAYVHADAYPRATQVPMATIEASDEDAVYYALEQSKLDCAGAGYAASPIDYGVAAMRALTHFDGEGKPWKIQRLANALCIARPTLSNRLRLLKGLCSEVSALLQTGALTPECAKILLGESNPQRQAMLAEQAVAGQWSTRTLYRQVHPQYQSPQLTPVKRTRAKAKKRPSADLELMTRTLQETLGAPTSITVDDLEDAAGIIDFNFYSLSELKGLIDRLDQKAQTGSLFQGTLRLQAPDRPSLDALLRETGAVDEPLEDYIPGRGDLPTL